MNAITEYAWSLLFLIRGALKKLGIRQIVDDRVLRSIWDHLTHGRFLDFSIDRSKSGPNLDRPEKLIGCFTPLSANVANEWVDPRKSKIEMAA